MQKLSLVLLAAGMGSRYGSLKQMDAFGPNGETIMDYSIYDAIRAGFNHIVFIVRESFVDAFKAKFENRFGDQVTVEFVTQELNKSIGSFELPESRVKPWGTAHALLMVKDVVSGPFAVVNADDYYGVEAFQTLAKYLQSSPKDFCIVAYELNNTLSEHGTVNRGVCIVDDSGNLKDVQETLKISKSEDGIIYPKEDGTFGKLDPDTKVSMNMFGFTPSFFTFASEQFATFLEQFGNEEKSEFYIPQVLDKEIKADNLNVQVFTSPSKWFGVTYKEDKPHVQKVLGELIEQGRYPHDLWG